MGDNNVRLTHEHDKSLISMHEEVSGECNDNLQLIPTQERHIKSCKY